MTIEWDSDKVDRPLDYFEFWYSSFDTLRFCLVDPSGARSTYVDHDPANRKQTFSSGGNDAYLDLTVHHPDNDDPPFGNTHHSRGKTYSSWNLGVGNPSRLIGPRQRNRQRMGGA